MWFSKLCYDSHTPLMPLVYPSFDAYLRIDSQNSGNTQIDTQIRQLPYLLEQFALLIISGAHVWRATI